MTTTPKRPPAALAELPDDDGPRPRRAQDLGPLLKSLRTVPPDPMARIAKTLALDGGSCWSPRLPLPRTVRHQSHH